MDAIQLDRIAAADPFLKRYYIGTYAADQIPKKVNEYPCCLIANTDPAAKMGTHWIAIYIDSNKTAEYFDSYGREPNSVFKNFMKNNFDNITWNKMRLQGLFTSVCGQYSLYFLMMRCRGKSMDALLREFEEKNFDFNDQFVTKVINDTFGENTSVVNEYFITNYLTSNLRQTCRCENDCSVCL